MDAQQALQRLSLQAGITVAMPRKGGTLPEMLRPFRGAIDEKILEEILVDIKVLIEREIGEEQRLQALLAIGLIVSTTRGWALDRDSMLVRNDLIDDAQYNELLTWVRDVERLSAVMIERALHVRRRIRTYWRPHRPRVPDPRRPSVKTRNADKSRVRPSKRPR